MCVAAVLSVCILKNLIKIGEFLCGHFNIKNGRKYVTFLAYYCFIISRKATTHLKCKKNICAVYLEGTVTDQMCQKVFCGVLCWRFLTGRCSTSSGRPVEVDSNQIETLRTINVGYVGIANILKISKSIKLL